MRRDYLKIYELWKINPEHPAVVEHFDMMINKTINAFGVGLYESGFFTRDEVFNILKGFLWTKVLPEVKNATGPRLNVYIRKSLFGKVRDLGKQRKRALRIVERAPDYIDHQIATGKAVQYGKGQTSALGSPVLDVESQWLPDFGHGDTNRVAEMLAEGYTIKEIAVNLKLPERVVLEHKKTIRLHYRE